MSPADLVEAVKGAEILVPTVTDRIDAAVLSHAGAQLRLIANFGNGVDHIDVATALSRGITVTNTPGVLTEDTADMTMALILAVPRRLAEGAAVMTGEREWNGWAPTWMLGHRIGGKRLGIIGMGRIGQAVARRARALRAANPLSQPPPRHAALESELEATWWESLDQMLARMDIISVNCPHTPATYHLLSARRLKLLRPDAYVVNTARGEVIDENALTRMIEAGEIGGAGLDVFEHEPAVNPEAGAARPRRQGGAAAPSRLGHPGGPRRNGRQGHHQHPDLHGRPPAPRPRAAVDAVNEASLAEHSRSRRRGARRRRCGLLTVILELAGCGDATPKVTAQPMNVEDIRRELVNLPLCGTPKTGPLAGKPMCTIHFGDGTATLAGDLKVARILWEHAGRAVCRRDIREAADQQLLRHL